MNTKLKKINRIMQFRLTDGYELICEVTEQTSDHILKIRNAFTVERISDGTQNYYALRSWMLQQVEEDDNIQFLNTNQIIASAMPFSALLKQYYDTINFVFEENQRLDFSGFSDSDVKNILKYNVNSSMHTVH